MARDSDEERDITHIIVERVNDRLYLINLKYRHAKSDNNSSCCVDCETFTTDAIFCADFFKREEMLFFVMVGRLAE